MFIHVVEAGQTLTSLAQSFSIPPQLLAEWNSIAPPYTLAVGQALIVFEPTSTYTVQPGNTAEAIADEVGITLRELYVLNPSLEGGAAPLFAGQTLVLDFGEEKTNELLINAYAYTFIDEKVMRQTLPYLSTFAPFTYGFTPDGELVMPDDERLISAAQQYGVSPLMHLSTLTENGNFSSELGSALLRSPSSRAALISNILFTILEKGYAGLDIDFEFIPGDDAVRYADFIFEARQTLSRYSLPVFAALAPKTSANQPGTLYEGHNYALIGEAADKVFLMTYEWGYTYGPPMAVAPIESVRRVLDYAVSEIPVDKIIMGIPNYGYDWTLPYKSGTTMAESISNPEAVRRAVINGAEIMFDEQSMSPYFYYFDGEFQHEVWFEDPRSIMAKLALVDEYGFYGVGYWNADRPFPANWLILSQKYNTRPSL